MTSSCLAPSSGCTSCHWLDTEPDALLGHQLGCRVVKKMPVLDAETAGIDRRLIDRGV
jgi:hypothetical protein